VRTSGNLEAYPRRLKARVLFHQQSTGTLRAALQQLRGLIEAFPDYALTYTALLPCTAFSPYLHGMVLLCRGKHQLGRVRKAVKISKLGRLRFRLRFRINGLERCLLFPCLIFYSFLALRANMRLESP
jgi:hypothetical protein